MARCAAAWELSTTQIRREQHRATFSRVGRAPVVGRSDSARSTNRFANLLRNGRIIHGDECRNLL